jgi:hypothetical protein
LPVAKNARAVLPFERPAGLRDIYCQMDGSMVDRAAGLQFGLGKRGHFLYTQYKDDDS